MSDATSARRREAFAALLELGRELGKTVRTADEAGPVLEAAIPGLVLHRHDGQPRTFGACPQQVVGHIGGDAFYFRFRHDRASLEVWSDSHDFGHPGLPAGTAARSADRDAVTGEPLAGWLDETQLVAVFTDLYERLA